MVEGSPAPGPATPGETPVLMFQVGGKQFAVALEGVQQIIEYQPPTRTPRRLPHVEGVIEYRGRFVPVASLRKRFGVTEPGPGHQAILLLTGIGRDPVVGLVVDQVQRVISLPPDEVLAPPPRMFGIRADLIRGVANAGGRPVVWLDVEKLLTSGEPVTLLA